MSDTSLATPQTKEETPTMTAATQSVIQNLLLQMNTSMPGIIETYNSVLQTVDVQPAPKRKYILDDEVVNLPIINSVPVSWPRAGQAVITFPLKKGDNVVLVFSQRSIDRWKATGGVYEVGDPRHHDLSDAFAFPGGYPQVDPVLGVDPTALVVQNTPASKISLKPTEMTIAIGGAKLTANAAGQWTIGNGVIELLGLLDLTYDAILKLTVGTGTGPSSPPINAAEFIALKTQLALIKGIT